MTVIQEFAYDHPFHNGIFVGQHPVLVGGRTGNFWAVPPRRSFDDAIWTKIGRMDVSAPPAHEALPDGYRFEFKSVWRDEEEQPLLDETRSVRFHTYAGAHAVDVASVKTAAYGAIEFPKTKYGSIGARVEPRLLPCMGSQIVGCSGGDLHYGLADEVANQKACDAVAYQSTIPGAGVYGICLIILDNSASPNRRGPWFIRDYGMAMFNATQQEQISVPASATWTAALRVIAYDGALTPERLSEWMK
jgi:hypothetical protein